MNLGIRHIAVATIVLSALLSASPTLAQVQVHGSVVDGASGMEIPFATAVLQSTGLGVACDTDGHFHMEVASLPQTLRISAMGFESVTIELNEETTAGHIFIQLEPTVLSFDEIVVSGNSGLVDDPSASPMKMNSTEDLLDRVPGADFFQRANFAWEPVIRGMAGGQVGIVIDDIKVIGACVDKMDPTSSYIEVENLEKLELKKGGFDLSHASQIGGTVNYVTEKPRFDNRAYATVEGGVESVSNMRRTSVVTGYSRGNSSVRASFSYKNAGDYSPGGGSEPIPHSGYEKNNLKVDVAQRFAGSHQLTASFLADNAWDVGYPVLLMDATLAQARIYSLTHNWEAGNTANTTWETRAYYNTVDHYMDDYQRDVMQREVMRGMNMPMFGNTRTAGGISRFGTTLGSARIGLTADVLQTDSFGDMWMFSLFPGIPDMYLLNLGDVRVRQLALSGNLSLPISAKVRTRIDARFDHSPRDVHDENARAILEGRWGTSELAQTYTFGSLSGSIEYARNATTRFRLSLAHVGRLPTHVENYGHYIYNYVDGYFYSGNPNLDYERSSQVELGYEQWTARVGIRASAYVNYIQNLIVGQPDDGLTGGSDVYQFRVFTNSDEALMWGGEIGAVLNLVEDLELAGSASYTWGHNIEFDEPMFLIPPLSALLALRYRSDKWFGEIETRMAAPQNRVAESLADEQPTDGYFVLNLRGSANLSALVTLNGGIENLFDALYHEHLSFGDLPAAGRNAYLGVTFSF